MSDDGNPDDVIALCNAEKIDGDKNDAEPSIKSGVYLVVADDSEEFETALHHAARRAKATQSRVGILYTSSMEDFQHWQNVEDMMKAELRDKAEKFVWTAAKKINDLNGLMPVFYLTEGERKEQVLKTIENDPSIKALVLAGQSHGNNAGPLVSYFTAKGMIKLSVPLVIVPGHLSEGRIDSFSI